MQGARLFDPAVPPMCTLKWPPQSQNLALAAVVFDNEPRTILSNVGRNGEGLNYKGRVWTNMNNGAQETDIVIWGPKNMRTIELGRPYIVTDCRFKAGKTQTFIWHNAYTNLCV